MKKTLITTLRNRNSSIEEFRQATDQLGTVLAIEADALYPKSSIFIDTPLMQTHGTAFNHDPLLIPILRSGLCLLSPFMRFYPRSTVGFIGVCRNEETAKPELYYSKVPPFKPETPIFVLEPIIATGGSATLAIKKIKELGASENQITLISFIASPEGITAFQKECPEVNVVIAQVDEGLNDKKWILPGLGDFGDRYFGTLNP